MSHPDRYPEFRDHIIDHAEQVRQIIISRSRTTENCGDDQCKWPAFWDGLTSEQLDGAVTVLIRLAHEMAHSAKANSMKYTEFLFHIVNEQLRRDGKVLSWECLSEGNQ